jgi:hypothetical protein
MRKPIWCLLALLLCLPTTTSVRADDAADVKAAEIAFNEAENAGKLDLMRSFALVPLRRSED